MLLHHDTTCVLVFDLRNRNQTQRHGPHHSREYGTGYAPASKSRKQAARKQGQSCQAHTPHTTNNNPGHSSILLNNPCPLCAHLTWTVISWPRHANCQDDERREMTNHDLPKSTLHFLKTEPVEYLSKMRAQNTGPHWRHRSSTTGNAHERATAESGQPPIMGRSWATAVPLIYITQGRSWALEDAPNVLETLVANVETGLPAAQRFAEVVFLQLLPS